MIHKHCSLGFLFCVISLMGFSDGTKKAEPAPELSVPKFEFESTGRKSAREVANQDEGKDILSELEGLLENPAQRDAKSQLGVPDSIVDPLPQVKLDIPIENPKKAEAMKPAAVPTPALAPSRPKAMVKAPEPLVKAPIIKKKTVRFNEFVSVDFVAEGKTQKLILSSTEPLKYRLISKKKQNQLIYVFEKTSLPKKLRRIYDTKEFRSSILSYKMMSAVNKKIPTATLQVQMREFAVPKTVRLDNKLVFEFEDKTKSNPERFLASALPSSSFGDNSFDSERGYTGEPIEKLELKNTDVSEAIKLVMRSSGYNVVLSDDVKGNIGSLSLQNTPWDQALHIILQMKKLGFIRKGNMVRIGTLDSLKHEQEEVQKQENLEPLKTVLIPVSYAKAATLAPRATPFLSSRGKVDIDDRTNTLIIRDAESVISRIQKLLNLLDVQPPMISISAKFLKVDKSFTRILGLGSMSMAGQTTGINFGTAQPPTVGGAGFSAGINGGLINLSAPKFAALNAQLIIAETQNKVKTLSHPNVVVQQGQAATITQGKTINIAQALGMNGAVTTPLSVTANLNLTVTPVVANDGSISLDANISDSDANNQSGTVTSFNRSLTTKIILQNGDTAVLGGVATGEEKNTDSGVPFLKDLPLLGYLFGQKAESVTQSEVLIFITARLLNPESAFKQKI
ncbi:MAG: secretin N-terminal domain-containing protein [Pseudomonadota bacterium]